MRKAHLDRLLIALLMHVEVPQLEALCPVPLMQIHQHRLFQLRFSPCYRDRVIMPIQAMYECLYRRLVDMPDIRRCLPWLTATHDGLRVNKTERIDHHLPFHGLNGVDDYADCPRVERLEGLKCE